MLLAVDALDRPEAVPALSASRAAPSKRIGPVQCAGSGACQNNSAASAPRPTPAMPAISAAWTAWTLLPKTASGGAGAARASAGRRSATTAARSIVARPRPCLLLRRDRGSARLHLAPAVVDRQKRSRVADVLERVRLQHE